MSNVTTGDLARIVAVDTREEQCDIGKVVAVGEAYAGEAGDWGELHWNCTSLNGPLVFQWWEDGKPTDQWDSGTTLCIADRCLRRIPPGSLGMEDEAAAPRDATPSQPRQIEHSR
jgi:hypothetical protein